MVARYSRDGIVEEIDPETCRITFGSWSWRSLAAGFAKYDVDIEVVGPPELREAFAQLADRFARAASTPWSLAFVAPASARSP